MEFGRNNTPFSEAEFASRLAKTKARMSAAGLDALVVSDPANMNYLTGYDGWSFYVHQAVIVGLELDQPIWIGRGQDANGAKLTTILPPDNIFGYSDDHVQSTTKHPMQFVAKVMRDRGLAEGTIGVEADCYYFTAKARDVLAAELPNARIRRRRRAGQLGARGEVRGRDRADARGGAHHRKNHAGGDRCDRRRRARNTRWRPSIQATGTRGIDGYGGDYPAIVPLMPTGVGTSCPHLTWQDAPFEAETGTTIEIAGVRRRYHVPMTRTVYLGKPPQKMADAAKVVVEGIAAALAVARPGAGSARRARGLDAHHRAARPLQGFALRLRDRPELSARLGRADDLAPLRGRDRFSSRT